MEDGAVKLPKFRLSTPYSDIDVELDMPLSLMEPVDPGKMRLRMNASLGKQDLMPFMADLPAAMRQRWPEYPLSVSGLLKGNMQHMDFHDLEVSLPTAFHATATGFAANLDDPQRLRADVQFTASTQNLGFVMAMLPRDMQRNYRIPPMSAQGRVKADGQQYYADITAREGRGTVKAKGSFNAAAMRYDADIKVRDLNVHHFMPYDSIYTVSADVVAKGQGTDFFSPRTTLVADAKIHHVGYGKLNIDNITAHALVSNGKAHANLVSRNPLLKGSVNFDALLSTTRFDGTLSTDFQALDLYAMGVVERPLTIGMCGHFDINSDLKLTHHATGLINDISITDSSHVYRPSAIDLLLNTTPDTTYMRTQSGDFIVKLDASGNYEQLLNQFMLLGDSAMAQLDRKTIDQPALRKLLPTMRMTVESKREDPVATFLKASADVDFKEMLFDLSTSVEQGVNGRGFINSLMVSDVRIDTINFSLTQRKERLSFGGQVRNNKKNPQFVFNALFDGIIQERGATLGVRYYDADNKLGARVGAQAEVVDSGLSLHLVPARPTLGYKEFAVNQDNFLFLGASGKVKAKVDLRADDGMGIRLYSEETDPDALQDLTLSLHQFNLAEITSVIPYAPRMTGMLNGDYHVVQDASGQFSIAGDIGVRNMTYERCPIGNISTEMVYLQKENDAHAIEARLMMDDDEIGLLTGTYYNEGEGSLDATLQLEHLPLNIVNGFVPDQLCGLQGYGEGTLTIQGALSRPEVNGEVYLSNSYLESVPYGVKLRFDDDPVRIQHSNLLFENFTVYAHNDNPLNVQGNVDFSDLDNMMVNLRMQANNFQIIGTKEHAKSVAYGKAFVNVFAMMDGPLDNLNMRGRLDVLGTTDMGYILRDTPITTDNQLDDLVKFTDFSDTTQIAVSRPPITGFRMDMTLNVSNGAHIKAYMNADHSNYIDLMGGGTLRMLYSPADNLQLTGRYTLSNGEMKYALPIIPLKTFTIQDGSYIEFTGDPMNPTLNIAAVEHTKATVTGTNGVGRSVAFDCGVNITRTLSDMGLEFTLDAPEDMQLHGELQAMGVEQRGKLAVTMLTTGMYLADGNTKPFSMNSALSSFLSSEISNLTGNALRTLDLSFGMDNSTDATGQTHTDYSFKFAKRFLNNRLKLAVGGKVTTGEEMPGGRNNSFFDNISLEYRLDDTANKYLNLYFENNSYDWLDGYTQKYGGGFIWRRTLQNFTDIFRFKDDSNTLSLPPVRTDSLKTTRNDQK
jgi:autotransporter translocation and assembly factor TamB